MKIDLLAPAAFEGASNCDVKLSGGSGTEFAAIGALKAFHFGIEFNFAGMPPGADDRYFFQGDHNHGHLGAWLAIENANEFGLADDWLGLKVNLASNQPTHFYTFPIETVSQSEGGFELVHQSVVLLPHWYVRGDQNGRWSVSMKLNLDTTLAESRMEQTEAVAG